VDGERFMVQKEIDYELLLFRCPHCKGPVRWHWNKATTGKVYCQNKCPEGRFLMELEDCQMVDEDEI